jgi:hypothetical protein
MDIWIAPGRMRKWDPAHSLCYKSSSVPDHYLLGQINFYMFSTLHTLKIELEFQEPLDLRRHGYWVFGTIFVAEK